MYPCLNCICAASSVGQVERRPDRFLDRLQAGLARFHPVPALHLQHLAPHDPPPPTAPRCHGVPSEGPPGVLLLHGRRPGRQQGRIRTQLRARVGEDFVRR